MLEALCDIRLAITEANLTKGYVTFSWGLPKPDLPVYNDSSTRVATADGGLSLRGWPSVILTWNRLSPRQARTVRKLVEDALDGGGLLYATIDRSWAGVGAQGDWIDVSGVPQLPQITPAGNTSGLAKDNVTLVINDLTIVNDPAVF